MRIHEACSQSINFGGENCMLNPAIAIMILQFCPSTFRKLMRLSPNWRYLLLSGMDQIFKPIEIDFANKYRDHLQFKRSYTNSSVFYSGGKLGLRIDKVLVCEVVKNRLHANKCLRVSYAYKLCSSKTEHGADYKMDILRESSKRLTWIHKDLDSERSDNEVI